MVQGAMRDEVGRVLFYVRMPQLKRALQELGFLRSFILLFLLVFLLAGTYRLSSYALPGLCVSVVLAIHGGRKDKRFLSILFPAGISRILLAEYLTLSLFFLVPLVLRNPALALFTLPLICTVPFLNWTFSIRLRDRLHLVNGRLYEISSGLRRGWPLLVLTYAGSFLLASFLYGSLIGMLLTTVIIQSFYSYSEPASFLRLYSPRKEDFLKTKLKAHSLVFLTFNFPFLLLLLLFHPGYWHIGIIFLLFCVGLGIFTITAKYTFYQPPGPIRFLPLLNGIGFICILIPFLLPVLFIMTYRFYIKALQNIDNYYHAESI
jgi:hypothetical protein